MLIERVEQAITKTPEEEQDSYNADGIDRLPKGQFGRPGAAVVGRLERAILEEFSEAHGRRRLSGWWAIVIDGYRSLQDIGVPVRGSARRRKPRRGE